MKRRNDGNQCTLDFDAHALFEIPEPQTPTAGGLDCGVELRHCISEIIKSSGRDRFAIAAEMSRLTGRDITKTMIDAWSAESRESWRFPFEFAPAFEAATNSYGLLQYFASKRGVKIYAGEDIFSAELGKQEALKAEINNNIRLLKQRLNAGKRKEAT